MHAWYHTNYNNSYSQYSFAAAAFCTTTTAHTKLEYVVGSCVDVHCINIHHTLTLTSYSMIMLSQSELQLVGWLSTIAVLGNRISIHILMQNTLQMWREKIRTTKFLPNLHRIYCVAIHKMFQEHSRCELLFLATDWDRSTITPNILPALPWKKSYTW